MAEASDDKDTPEQLRYSWKGENLDTGKEVERSTGGRNRLSWTPRSQGRIRITVSVADRDGAEGQDSIEIGVEKPEIEKIEFKGAERNKTSDYLDNGIPASRRGQYFGIDIIPRHYNPKIHNARLYIDGERIEKGEPNPTKWVFLRAKRKKTELGMTDLRYYVFTPSAVPIGRYKIEVALTNDETDEEMDRKALDPELIVLFNPFPGFRLEDESVRAGNPLDEDEADFYTLASQNRTYHPDDGGTPGRPFDVSPYETNTLEAALSFLEELPEADRADAEKVAGQLTYSVSEMVEGLWQQPYCLIGGSPRNVSPRECEQLDGEWAGGICYLGGAENPTLDSKAQCVAGGGVWIGDPFWRGSPPWSWSSVSKICERYTTTKQPVKYVQCFTYGHILTALQRSLGIPTRTVSTWGSGHDKLPPWGIQSTFYDKSGKNIDYEVWNFHCWNEAWLPPVNSGSGWAILDATPQSRASDGNADLFVAVPGLDEVPRVHRLPKGQQYPDGRDDVFVYTECNLPCTNYIKVDCEFPYPEDFWDRTKHSFLLDTPPTVAFSATHVYFESPSGREDGIQEYRPATPSSSGYTASSILFPSLESFIGPGRTAQSSARKPSVMLSGPKEISLGASFRGGIEVTGMPSDAQATLIVLVNYFPFAANGGAPGRGSAGPRLKFSRELKISPHRGSWSGTIDIPGDVFSVSGRYRWNVTVGSADDGSGSEVDILVRGIPLVLTVPAHISEGETVLVKAVLTNSLDTEIAQAQLLLKLPSSWKTSSPLSVGPQLLAPAAELILEAQIKAEKAGKFLIGAEGWGTGGPSYAGTEVVVVGKPEIAIDALPIQGAPVGKVFEAPVEIINDGIETANDVVVRLTSVEGIKVIGEPTQKVKILEGRSQVNLVWKIRAESKGIFRLPIEASQPGGPKAEEIIVIYAGGDDPEEMEAQEEVPEAGISGEPGGAAETGSDTLTDLDEAAKPAPKVSERKERAGAEASRKKTGGGPASASAGGGGPAVKASPSIPLPLLGLLVLLIVNTGLVIALMMRRRKPSPGAQKVGASIEVLYLDGGSKVFVIRQARTTIGRAGDNSLVIHDPDVSSHHAEIVVSGGAFLLRDLGSANGTFLNGERIDEAPVYQGDDIVIGSTRLMITG